ncbi:hypothetical protein BDZ91DRAFT_774595 [Kalaharituber pfeilii]|nr:hypothetical protein BDZ91DRAFT_774595 [Kalaharituber pfeilii]
MNSCFAMSQFIRSRGIVTHLAIQLIRQTRPCITQRCYSISLLNENHKKTIKNLAVGKETKVMFQGFTGRQATVNATQSIAYGTNIVGGITPGKSSKHLGLPVYPTTVKKAAKYLKPDATSIFVSAAHATAAIIEAIEAEIPLISAVTEHIPVHDMLRIHSILRTQSKSRLLWPNSPGMLHAACKSRIGFIPYPQFIPGVVGIVGKSGTLGYEAVASTTRLGQSYGEGTEEIIIIGEIGGDGEQEVAEFLREKRGSGDNIKTMSHSGAFASSLMGDISARDKQRVWIAAGVELVMHPGQFGEGMLRLLKAKTDVARRAGLSRQQVSCT